MSGAAATKDELRGFARSTPNQDAWVLEVLGIHVGGGETDGAVEGGPSLVALQKSRLAWDSLRKSVQSQLRSIEQAALKAVEEHNKDEAQEDEYDPGEVATKLQSTYSILEKLDERLIKKLDEALNAEGAERARLNREARDIVREYQATVATDKMLGRIDLNGFAKTSIRDGAERTLAVLARQL